MLSFSLIAEALAGLIYHRPSGKNFSFRIHTGVRGGVAFLVKHGLVINKEYRNRDFNIITDNEALVVILTFLTTKI